MNKKGQECDKTVEVCLKENEQYYVYELKNSTDYREFGTKEIRYYTSKGLIL